jgi:protein-S-isoprenylcysteine O-methyltransferase Ste14
VNAEVPPPQSVADDAPLSSGGHCCYSDGIPFGFSLAKPSGLNVCPSRPTAEIVDLTLLDYICWGAFGLVWALGAAYNAVKGPAAARKSRAWYGRWFLGLGLFWLVLLIVPPSFWSALSYRPEWLALVGAILLVASTVFTLWARLFLGRMWSSAPMVRESHELRTTGPYAVTRHPIYTGMLGMLLGTTFEHGFGIALLFLLVVLVLLEIKIHLEERLMAETFGEKYAAYKRRVPQLVPGLRSPLGRWRA